ncbi:MAG: hypothetical protein IJ937_09730, partial [Treponema sp.]|nr:hypothetical protein [Treponema sp.]
YAVDQMLHSGRENRAIEKYLMEETSYIGVSKIVAGADKEIAKKYGEYSKLGKNSIKGRIVGTELVTL